MSWQRIYGLVARQLYLVFSNPTRLISIFLWVLIDILIWGFVTKYLGNLGQANFTFINVVLGAIIMWNFTSRIEQGTMTGFLEDMWSHNFINIFSSPVKVSEYLSGLVVTSIITGIFAFGFMLLLSAAAFGYNLFKIGLMLLPFLLILFIFGMSMGIFASSLIFRLGPAAEWLGWPIPLVLSVFSGVFYPVATLPVLMQAIAHIIPASYVFESLRAILTNNSLAGLEQNMFLAFILSLIYLLLSSLYFNRVYKHNLKNGSLAKFNAE